MIDEGEYNFILEVKVLRSLKRQCEVKLFEASGADRIHIQAAKIQENGILSAPGYQANIQDVLQMFKDISESIYIGPFRNAIQVGSTSIYYDIQIGKDFIELWNYKKTGHDKKASKAIHKLEKDIQRIFGLKELSINANSDKNGLQLLIDGDFYDLTEVGAGLSQLIIVLTNVLIKSPPFIIIDEPESSLHPSLQIDFLTTLGSYGKRGVLLATHNIGLARAVSNQIYSLVKIDNGKSNVRALESVPRLSEFLGELSFSGYQELGFNKILLVEGRTEIKTFMQLLRLYDLDHKIVILPLGGNDLINGDSEQELFELTRISVNISAIIDSEKTNAGSDVPKARKEFAKICKKIGIDCHILERRAIENYLSEKAIKSLLGSKYKALEYYEKLEETELGWSKNDNWKIARLMTIEDIEGTDLEIFLNGLAKSIG